MARPLGARAAFVAGLTGLAVLLGVVGGALGSDPDLRLAASADGYATTTGESPRGSRIQLVAGGLGAGAAVTYLKFDLTNRRAQRKPARAEITLTRRAGELPGLLEISAVPATSWREDGLAGRAAPRLGSVIAAAQPDRSDRSVRFDVSSAIDGRGTYAFAVTAPGGGLADFFDADGVRPSRDLDAPTLRVSWQDAVRPWAGVPGVPQPGQLPALPSFPRPSLPNLPDLPDLPDLPWVPDLPDLPDLPSTPTDDPTDPPIPDQTDSPSPDPTDSPSPDPTDSPSPDPTVSPTGDPTVSPTGDPTDSPTPDPTDSPTPEPTDSPTPDPTVSASPNPTVSPTPDPTDPPTPDPTDDPTTPPTTDPTTPAPTTTPTAGPPSPTPTTSPSGPSDPRCTLGAKLVPTCGVLWGVAPGAHTDEPRDQALADFEADTGRTQAIYHAYHRGTEIFPTSMEMRIARDPAKPRLLFLNWKPTGASWAEIARGDEDTDNYLDRLAEHIRDNFTEPFFFTVHHEPENDVRPAKGSGYTATDYRDMFRYVINRLRAQGVTNLVSVMVHMAYIPWLTQSWWEDLYPGDDVVDWLAWDVYAYSDRGEYGYGDLEELLNRTSSSAPDWPGFYNYAAAKHPTKPFMLAEWGVWYSSRNPGHMADFFDSVRQQISLFPRVKAMVYFDTPADQSGKDSRVTRTSDGLAAYRRLGQDPTFQVDLAGP